jgi:hypothetical protein
MQIAGDDVIVGLALVVVAGWVMYMPNRQRWGLWWWGMQQVQNNVVRRE